MNLLGLIFSILLILSFGYCAIWDKHRAGRHLRNTYTSHSEASRQLINEFESEIYNGIGAAKKEPQEENHQGRGNRHREKEEEKEKIPDLNPECARLNLWPLIHEGKEAHPELYDLAIKLISTFYGSLGEEKQFEIRLLNQILSSAKKTEPFSLEKIVLDDPTLQKVYYKMLKGTKEWDLCSAIGYPPLLDYVKAEQSAADSICVFHAHPDMITVLFNAKLAWKIYQEIHKKEAPPLTKALIERLAFECRIVNLDPELFKLLTLDSFARCAEQKKIFIAKDGDVQIRKTLHIHR